MHQLVAIWSPADRYMCRFFFPLYENSLKSGLVNLSEIISRVVAVIDCGSDGNENQVRLTLTSHSPFSMCRLCVAEKWIQ